MTGAHPLFNVISCQTPSIGIEIPYANDLYQLFGG